MKIYINDSFCPEDGFINYVIRQAYKNKHIVKVRNGVNYVKKDETINVVEIGHVHDRENLHTVEPLSGPPPNSGHLPITATNLQS